MHRAHWTFPLRHSVCHVSTSGSRTYYIYMCRFANDTTASTDVSFRQIARCVPLDNGVRALGGLMTMCLGPGMTLIEPAAQLKSIGVVVACPPVAAWLFCCFTISAA